MISYPTINIGILQEGASFSLPLSYVTYVPVSGFKSFWNNLNTGFCAAVKITTTGTSQQFILNWGDGTISTGTSPTQLNHSYDGVSCSSIGGSTASATPQISGTLNINLCANGANGCNPNNVQYVNLDLIAGTDLSGWAVTGQSIDTYTYASPYFTQTGYKLPKSGLITADGSGYWLVGQSGGNGRVLQNYTITASGQSGQRYIYGLYYNFY